MNYAEHRKINTVSEHEYEVFSGGLTKKQDTEMRQKTRDAAVEH